MDLRLRRGSWSERTNDDFVLQGPSSLSVDRLNSNHDDCFYYFKKNFSTLN